jgi:N-hydroxyarylamine O-acetyltransferase
MSPIDLGAYCARIAYGGPHTATRETLTALSQAHQEAIPFENLDILLGRGIALALPAVEAKLVGARRGGYCFEQNALFQAALTQMGFTVTPLAARVRGGDVPIRPRTHMLLRVDLAEGPFLADVGFGGDGPLHPLPLRAEGETWTFGFGYKLRREGDQWVLMAGEGGPWTDLYAFTEEPAHAVDYEMANHFTSTWPRSPFVLNLTAQRSWAGGRLILRNRDLTRRQGASVERSVVADPDHLLRVLAGDFGLAFPTGTRFSRPDFSAG